MDKLHKQLDKIHEGLASDTELENFYKAFRKYIVRNFNHHASTTEEKLKNAELNLLKNVFYKACRKNYYTFYYLNLRHLDGNYLKKFDIFILLIETYDTKILSSMRQGN